MPKRLTANSLLQNLAKIQTPRPHMSDISITLEAK